MICCQFPEEYSQLLLFRSHCRPLAASWASKAAPDPGTMWLSSLCSSGIQLLQEVHQVSATKKKLNIASPEFC